jgi:hypothetical protein
MAGPAGFLGILELMTWVRFISGVSMLIMGCVTGKRRCREPAPGARSLRPAGTRATDGPAVRTHPALGCCVLRTGSKGRRALKSWSITTSAIRPDGTLSRRAMRTRS